MDGLRIDPSRVMVMIGSVDSSGQFFFFAVAHLCGGLHCHWWQTKEKLNYAAPAEHHIREKIEIYI